MSCADLASIRSGGIPHSGNILRPDRYTGTLCNTGAAMSAQPSCVPVWITLQTAEQIRIAKEFMIRDAASHDPEVTREARPLAILKRKEGEVLKLPMGNPAKTECHARRGSSAAKRRSRVSRKASPNQENKPTRKKTANFAPTVTCLSFKGYDALLWVFVVALSMMRWASLYPSYIKTYYMVQS